MELQLCYLRVFTGCAFVLVALPELGHSPQTGNHWSVWGRGLPWKHQQTAWISCTARCLPAGRERGPGKSLANKRLKIKNTLCRDLYHLPLGWIKEGLYILEGAGLIWNVFKLSLRGEYLKEAFYFFGFRELCSVVTWLATPNNVYKSWNWNWE